MLCLKLVRIQSDESRTLVSEGPCSEFEERRLLSKSETLLCLAAGRIDSCPELLSSCASWARAGTLSTLLCARPGVKGAGVCVCACQQEEKEASASAAQIRGAGAEAGAGAGTGEQADLVFGAAARESQ